MKNHKTSMRISEVAQIAGIRSSAIRYYESVGLLPRPMRVGGRRQYDPSILTTLKTIEVAKTAGFTIAEIKKLLYDFGPDDSPSSRWRALARQKLVEVESLLASIIKMKQILERGLACQCLGVEDCTLLINSFHH